MEQVKLTASLQKIIEEGYQQAGHYFKVVSYRQVVFKGFFSQEIYQEILSNQEILANLKITNPQLKKYFGEELQKLIDEYAEKIKNLIEKKRSEVL